MIRRCMLSSSFPPLPPARVAAFFFPPSKATCEIFLSLSLTGNWIKQTPSSLNATFSRLLLRRARSSPPPPSPTPQIKISFRPDAHLRPVSMHTQVSAAEKINLGAQFFEGNEEGGVFFVLPLSSSSLFPLSLLVAHTSPPSFLGGRGREDWRGERGKEKRRGRALSSLPPFLSKALFLPSPPSSSPPPADEEEEEEEGKKNFYCR